MPTFVFVNKCDRWSEGPLKLLDDVESELGLPCYPITWPFDEAAMLEGRLAPAFFGSALTNFGVEPFLRHFLRLAPADYLDQRRSELDRLQAELRRPVLRLLPPARPASGGPHPARSDETET